MEVPQVLPGVLFVLGWAWRYEDPDRGLSWLDFRVVAVPQYLDPFDCVFGEDRPHLAFDAP